MDVSGFPHQVGGHFGLLKCCGHVCKPLNQREFSFYLQMNKCLQPFTAQCCGRIKVNLCAHPDGTLVMATDTIANCHNNEKFTENVDDHSPSTSRRCNFIAEHSEEVTEPLMTFRLKSGKVEAEQATNLWAGQCQSKVVQKLLKGYDKWFMLLEDIVAGYRQPCVIDLKMGTRQYGDDASVQKRLSQTQKCRQSTSEEMGVRMVGMELYERHLQQYSYVNKYEGRRMDRSKFCAVLTKFLNAAGRERMLNLIEKLKQLRSTLREAHGYRFFSSSILIAYDGYHGCETNFLATTEIDLANSTVSRTKQALIEPIHTIASIVGSPSSSSSSSSSYLLAKDYGNNSISCNFDDSEDGESSLSTLSFSLDDNGDDTSSTSTMQQTVPPTTDFMTISNLDNTNTQLLDEINKINKSEVPKIVLKMIDFAHSTFGGFLDDEAYEGLDDGYLLGIESLIEIVNSILDDEGSTLQNSTENDSMSSMLCNEFSNSSSGDTSSLNDEKCSTINHSNKIGSEELSRSTSSALSQLKRLPSKRKINPPQELPFQSLNTSEQKRSSKLNEFLPDILVNNNTSLLPRLKAPLIANPFQLTTVVIANADFEP